MGFGTVGRAFFDTLEKHQAHVVHRTGEAVSVSRVLVRHPERYQDIAGLLADGPEAILSDPTIAIVVEVMGGYEPARSYILEALLRGKSVVTANKEVIARAGQELWEAAERGGGDLFFEASVGAGMPVVQGLKKGLQGNRIEAMRGLLNGTTNYILSRMASEDLALDAALAEAQQAGFAEADPTDDIAGYDAARKIAILASIGFGSRVRPEDVAIEGMGHITRDDVRYAQRQGWVLKLVAEAARHDDRVSVQVGPAFLSHTHPLAAVAGAYNAVYIHADPVGEVMFYGPGAGGLATASAVLGDVMEAVANKRNETHGVRCTCYQTLPFVPSEDRRASVYFRLDVKDQPGTLSQVAEVLNQESIGVRSIQQEVLRPGQVRLFLVTHECRWGDVWSARGRMEALAAVAQVSRPIVVIAS